MVNVPAAAAERICSLFIRLLLFILGIWKCLKEAYCLLLGKDQSFLMHLRQKCCCQRRSRNLFLYSSPFPLYRFWSVAVQKSSGKLTTIGSGVLRTTTHRNGRSFEGLSS